MSGRGRPRPGLVHLYQEQPGRTGRDRLEILTTLIAGPSFGPVFRPDVIKIPRDHPVFRWNCLVRDCERVRSGGTGLCKAHGVEFTDARSAGTGLAAFLDGASPLPSMGWTEEAACRVCPGRPASHTVMRLCLRHQHRWQQHAAQGGEADFGQWLADEQAFPGFGNCVAAICPGMACSPVGLCSTHLTHYEKAGRPGGAEASRRGAREHEKNGTPLPVLYVDEAAFRRWCASTTPVIRGGQVNLLGLRPLLRAEIKWCMFAYTQQPRPGRWDLLWLQRLVNLCRDRDLSSLVDLDLQHFPRFSGGLAKTMLHTLRMVYFTPDGSREAGFLETEHFGVRLPGCASHVDLTAIQQRWLRDLLWDHLAALLRSPQCPRTRTPIDAGRRGITELGAFLEADAPGGGHDPALLTAACMQRFVADQRQRERDGLPSLAMTGSDRKPSTVTSNTRAVVFNSVRKVLREAMENGRAAELGLAREFIVEMPVAGAAPLRPRRPFPDEVARALADGDNLARLAKDYDPDDQGLRDIWEAIVITGRRGGEVRNLRWDCIGRYGGLALFWHDQTKVGNYDASIRIPERLYELLATRQAKTADQFIARHGRRPTPAERQAIALFPSKMRNADSTKAVSYSWFSRSFRCWLEDLDIGRWVPHQARHTLATSLLRHGATLTHIRKYLGQVSDRMAEHYVHLSNSDLEDVLQQVWVAGPGSARPGELLAGEAAPLSREQAVALAIDLSRRSTPAEGGFCTFQPVVDGGSCPWNLDCHNCDKFVLSGADLLYWRRKREQWRLLAEGAPDDATADYLHAYFEPTARAIDGLEKALAGLGLLEDALALDMRKPQDYFQRVWSTAFRATDLARAGEADVDDASGGPGEEG